MFLDFVTWPRSAGKSTSESGSLQVLYSADNTTFKWIKSNSSSISLMLVCLLSLLGSQPHFPVEHDCWLIAHLAYMHWFRWMFTASKQFRMIAKLANRIAKEGQPQHLGFFFVCMFVRNHSSSATELQSSPANLPLSAGVYVPRREYLNKRSKGRALGNSKRRGVDFCRCLENFLKS